MIPNFTNRIGARISDMMRGDGLKARATRSAFWALTGRLGGQGMRLAANLALTRILFPEAFGLMALVNMFILALGLFSDLGLRASVIQSDRSDDKAFLDTVWTVQVIRGILLWLIACGLAAPMAGFYQAPMLAEVLPVAGLTAVLNGFWPTKIFTANRDLAIGGQTLSELLSQAIGIAVMVALALAWGSVWALVVGGLFGALVKLVLFHVMIPGPMDSPRFELRAFREILTFGVWIFLSTILGFVVSQGDRAILGKFLTLDELGVYSIGFFIATLPFLLTQTVASKVLFPLYRIKPGSTGGQNRKKIRTARALMSAGAMGVSAVFMFGGILLIDLLYDPRYAGAGAIVVVLCAAGLVKIITVNTGSALLAAGDSRSLLVLVGALALVQTTLILLGLQWVGLIGALAAPALTEIIVYPLTIVLQRRLKTWDPLHDAGFAALAVILGAAAVGLHWAALGQLMTPLVPL